MNQNSAPFAETLPATRNPRGRAREHGFTFGSGLPGTHNAITDVAGVRVGQITLIQEIGPIRTGVTAIIPHSQEVTEGRNLPAGRYLFGGAAWTGEAVVQDFGTLSAPIVLTSALCVGRAYDAVISYGGWPPLILGVDDGFLNDSRRRAVTSTHVLDALRQASSGVVAEGNVGAGTGVLGLGFKSGVGTASRQIAVETGRFRIGTLVILCGGRPNTLRLTDRAITGPRPGAQPPSSSRGDTSIIIATDAPLTALQLDRLAEHAFAGVVRRCRAAPPEAVVIAFATGPSLMSGQGDRVWQVPWITDGETLESLWEAAADATEEAMLNGFTRAQTMTGRNGHRASALFDQ